MARKKTDLFARLSLDYADHPKIQALSDAAFRAHVEMILYARRYLTDGRIPNRVANRFGSDVLSELSTNDEERPSLAQDEHDDYWLHGYADMQETRDEVTARRLVNSANGSRGGRPAKPAETQPVTESQTERGTQKKAETETETETEERLSSPIADATPDPRPDVEELCKHLARRIVENGNKKPTIGKLWRQQARLLLDTDKRDPKQAHALIDWCQQDSFWVSNILSMSKFREKYDTLRLQAEERGVLVGTGAARTVAKPAMSAADRAWQTPKRDPRFFPEDYAS